MKDSVTPSFRTHIVSLVEGVCDDIRIVIEDSDASPTLRGDISICDMSNNDTVNCFECLITRQRGGQIGYFPHIVVGMDWIVNQPELANNWLQGLIDEFL